MLLFFWGGGIRRALDEGGGRWGEKGAGVGNSHTDKHGRARTVGESRERRSEVRENRTAGTASALGERSYRTAEQPVNAKGAKGAQTGAGR